MNQNQIQQLTSHLSQALDQNYDVVNMEAVLSVICALEGTTITKEQLEATRLAKYINQLRRRTKNDQLARRAKSLLKKWREMVGIHQQTSIDSQCQPADHSAFKPIVETDIAESNAIEVGLNPLQYTSQPLSPTLERVISNLHSNIDSSEPTNFSSLINNNIKIDNSDESMTVVNKLFIKQPKATEFKSQKQIFINEHSSNSVSTVFMANDKLNQASIVIDIVSDSDENDVVNSKKNLAAEPSSSNYSRPKKLKKDKKCKDGRDKSSSFNFKGETSQQSSNSNRSSLHRSLVKESRTSNIYSTDPEILSLSNSSMSSILSGDAMSGNFQTRLHTPAADLTFAGRFKSVGQLEICSNLNSVPANGQKSIISNEPTSIELPTRPIYEYNNDSSTSCSRLSPYEELEAKQCLNPFTTCDETLPKKRGRKKGSKGVDSLIAKESSLSQQIFFGSGVKKVKTTKELFNDIQSRKLSISMNYGDNTIITPLAANRILNTTSTNRNLECQPLHTRPTSSCSETSIHSPHALEPISANIALPGTEKFSNTLENHGNTDSDTVTSEPSRDSKPRNMRIHSLDSNSNSLQQTPPAKNEENIGLKADYNDVTTQLVHIVRSLSNPLPVDEIEKRYQAEMVPCTCIIVEDMPKESFDRNKTSQTNMESDFLNRDLCGIEISGEKKPTDQTAMKKENCVVDAAEQTIVQKPMRSIFDLDFDDDDDPLQTIIQNIAPPESNVKATLDIHVDPTEANAVSSLADEYVNKDLKAVVSNSFSADQEYSNIIADPLNVYTVHEDPECIARKRFSVQTNDVTNFHINALHNYYIPNINGNWNSIDSSLVLTSSSITEFVQTLESYTVTDGSDVVPKYGSLTYEQRIRKDLSYLKFVQNYKPKSFKAFIPPFLGVAKCLPTCRLAAKRLKDNTKAVPIITSYNTFLKQEKSEMYCSYFENNRCSSNPLSVEVNTNNTDKSYENQARCSNDNPIDDNTALSYNLLKLANNNSEDPESKEKAYDLNTGSANIQLRRCRSNSTCSSSSFQLTQDSINEKPRNQGTKVTEKSAQSESNVERNRKKRRKSTRQSGESNDNIHHLSGENPLIKRIKISMNGNVEPHSQISVISSGNISSSDEDETHIEIDKEAYDTTGYCHSAQPVSDDEHESNRSHSTTVDSIMADEDDPMENDYDNNSDDEEYAIVQRPLAQGSGGNNHIVLTIKKTPSKINSPVNSISANSPIVGVASEAEILSGKQPESEITASYQRQLSLEQKAKPNAIQLTSMPDTYYNNFEKCYRYNHRHRFRHRHSHRQQICHKKTIDIELNHLFNNVSHSAQSVVKTHQKLFFTNELCRQDRSGRNERIVNYSSSSSSSSSSSYCNSSSNEDDYSETEERNHNAKQSEQCHIAFSNTYKLVNETDSIASVKSIAVNHGDHQDDDPQEHLYFYSSNESLINDDDDDVEEQLNDIKLNTINELPLENNGMLPSFNSIGPADYHQPNLTLAADLNGNDANISYTDDNLSVIQSHSLDCVSDASKMQYAINNITSNVMFKNSENDTQIMSQPTIEYRSGIRGVVDDSTGNKCCSRVQQFKEWHQVLQLQSYNNEPLIVLPYVVLE